MANTSSGTSLSVPIKSTFACIRCSERKVKCDRQRPCSACVNHKVDCVFQPPKPPQKRQKHIKDRILIDRLRLYETLLRENGIDPNELPNTLGSDSQQKLRQSVTEVPSAIQLQTPSSILSEGSESLNKTQVIHGQERSMFVDNLWSRLVEEFHDPDDALEDFSNDSSDPEVSDDDFNFVLGSQSNSDIELLHPPPNLIHQLWEVFKENIDPLTKVIHVPTLQPAIQRAASNTKAIPRSFETLMFAIYAVSVLSLSNDECRQRLGESRKTLLSRYITATKEALLRARFMGTTSLVVLQALILHLVSVRDIYEPRAIWSLTGVAIRIAQGMGLERDGEILGLSPFQTEMRRRIWWMLKTHDYRIAELCGLRKFRDIDISPDSTKLPSNVNDDQLYPSMSTLPAESETLTDAAFISLRCELNNFAISRVAKFRQEGKNSSQFERDLASTGDKTDMNEALKEIEGFLETKYLRYCDPSQPLHLLTMLMARASMNTIRFLTHHPRKWASIDQIPPSERQYIWEASIKLLEQHNMLQSNPMLKRFAWHAAFVMQWHAFIHVLDTLRAHPLVVDAEKAWGFIGSTFENNSVMLFNTRKPIHVAVGSLCLEAYSARVAALQQQNRNVSPLSSTPEFILRLRQQRERAKAKRQAQIAKTNQAGIPISIRQDHDRTREIQPKPSTTAIDSKHDNLNSTNLQQNLISQHSNSTHFHDVPPIDSDPFWIVNGIDDSQAEHSNDVMEMMDLDFMLAQDGSIQDVGSQNVSWEQWDTWLAESSAISHSSSVRE